MSPDSILIPVEQTRSFVLLNLYWIIPASAVFAGVAWAIVSFFLRRAAGRARMIPADPVGMIELIGEDQQVNITLINCGTNPAVEGKGTLIFFDGRCRRIWQSDPKQLLWHNPIAANKEWRLHQKIVMFPPLGIEFIYFEIEYKDQALNKTYSDPPFIWAATDEGELFEPSSEDRDRILEDFDSKKKAR